MTIHQSKIEKLIAELCPSGVEFMKFGEVCEIADNKRRPVASSLRVAGKIPYYGANNIQDHVEGFTHEGDFVLIAEDGSASLENYSIQFTAVFTDEKPFYALLDCKANKGRPLAQIGELGREVHLHFEFDNTTCAGVSSIKTAQSDGLLGPRDVQFDDVWVAPAHIEIEDFYTLCAHRDSAKLADICKAACCGHEMSTDVAPGIIVAVMTSAGKYGLFLAKELTPTSVSIDACHVLLP